MAIGFPFAWLAERYGLSPVEVERVLAMRESEREADPLAQIVASGGLPAPQQLPAAPAEE